MSNLNLLIKIFLFLAGMNLCAAQNKADIPSPWRWEDLPYGVDTAGYEFIKNNDTSYTLVEYHPNGKMKRKADIRVYYKAIDTIFVIDPITLEETAQVEGPGYRAHLHGPYVEFDSSGNKLIEGKYAYDMKIGDRTEWYSSGKQRSEEFYLMDELVGRCKYWYPTGVLAKVQYMPAGDYKDYHENGQLKSTGNYIFFKEEPDTVIVINPLTMEEEMQIYKPWEYLVKDGEWIYYDEKGKVIRRETYVLGVKRER